MIKLLRRAIANWLTKKAVEYFDDALLDAEIRDAIDDFIDYIYCGH